MNANSEKESDKKDLEKNINEEAHKLAEKDISHEKEMNKVKDENADIDEGELARKEGHP